MAVPAFPDTDLEITVSAAFGADATTAPDTWTWTDLSSRLLGNTITINRGVLVGQGSKRSSSSTLTLLNDDGALTPLLATSPYYPYVDLGTPMKIELRSIATPWVADTFTRTTTGGFGVADTGQNWLNNANNSTNGSAGQMSLAAANTTRISRILRPYADADVVSDYSVPATATGAPISAGPQLRLSTAATTYLWPLVEFSTTGTINIAVWMGLPGSTTNLVAPTAVPGLTYSAGTMIRLRTLLIGTRLRVKAWLASASEPASWAVDTTLPANAPTGGNYACVAAWAESGNTNTYPLLVSVDNVAFSQPKYPRLAGYITDVRPSFQPLTDGTFHSVVQIDIGGIGTRLENKAADPLSPLRRSIQNASVPPAAYWPLEDASASTTAASAFVNSPAMSVAGPAVFDFDTGVPDDAQLSKFGSTAIVSVAAGASLTGAVTGGSSTAWSISAFIQEYTAGIGGGVTEVRLLEWQTPSASYTRWALVRNSSNTFVIRAYTASGSTDVASWNQGAIVSTIYFTIWASVSGSTININNGYNNLAFGTGTLTGTSIGPITQITVNPDKVNTTGSVDPYGIRFLVGHVAVWTYANGTLPAYLDGAYTPRADQGWGYESAHKRLARLCGEEAVPFTLLGDPDTTGVTRLNVQQPGTFTDLITAAADAESGGILTEGGFGYTYLPRTARYNTPVVLTVDMSTYCRTDGTDATSVLVPSLNARGPNFWTVQRTNGSSSTYAAGADYRKRRGTVSDKATLDVLYDSDTGPHAQWRTHLYVDGAQANYPNLTLDLAANPALAEDFLRLQIGSRVQRTNQPALAGYGTIDQVIDQMSESFSPRQSDTGPTWSATLDASPAGVWQVGVYDTQLWDSSSTTLAANVTATGTQLGFSTTLQGDVWSTTDSPIAVLIAGQTTSVLWMSAIGSVAVAEGGFETGISGWQGTALTLTQTTAFARTGSYSVQAVVTGTPGTASLLPVAKAVVAASTSYTVTAWVYATGTVSNVRTSLSWYTPAGTFISTNTGTLTTIPAGVWTQVTVTAAAPSTAGLAWPSVQLASTPATGTTVYVDDVDITLTSAGSGPYLQNAWVVRDPVVVAPIPAGTQIHVADPLTWAL